MPNDYIKTEKMKDFARFISELKERGVRGEEYRSLVAEWREEWKRRMVNGVPRSSVEPHLPFGVSRLLNWNLVNKLNSSNSDPQV